jgi:hemerythrin-like metal-binding protein
MTKFEWKEEDFSVGIKVFDEEHKKLIQVFNTLYEAISTGCVQEHLEEILHELSDYTISHFIHEEEAFRKYNYPEYEEHLAQHNEFRVKIKDLILQHKSGSFSFGMPVFHLLISWIRNHIQIVDRKYKDYLNNKGMF